MSWYSNLAAGTLPGWGTFFGVIVALIGTATVFIRGWPARHLAALSGDKMRSDITATQLQEFRDEVHGYRNDLQIMQIRLNKAESSSRLRADRITNMTFVIRLLISELKRLDPVSVIVLQAEGLLSQMLEQDIADGGSIGAVASASKTVQSAQRTVAELLNEELTERN